MKTKIASFAVLMMLAAQTLAGDSASSSADDLVSRSADAVRQVPELDGGFAFIALALTAGLIALIRERKRT